MSVIFRTEMNIKDLYQIEGDPFTLYRYIGDAGEFQNKPYVWIENYMTGEWMLKTPAIKEQLVYMHCPIS